MPCPSACFARTKQSQGGYQKRTLRGKRSSSEGSANGLAPVVAIAGRGNLPHFPVANRGHAVLEISQCVAVGWPWYLLLHACRIASGYARGTGPTVYEIWACILATSQTPVAGRIVMWYVSERVEWMS